MVSIKSHSKLYFDVNGSMVNNFNMFDHHFNYNELTILDHYLKSDALAYSAIFLGRVDWYEERIYKMASYIVETYW